MKAKTILAAWLLAGTTCATAQTTDSLTKEVTTVQQPEKVIVTSTPNSLEVYIEGSKDDPNYHFTRSLTTNVDELSIEKEFDFNFRLSLPTKKDNARDWYEGGSEATAGAFGFGFANVAGAPDAMDINMGKSLEFRLQCLEWRIRPRHSNWEFSTGLWVNWRNYRMTGRERFDLNSNGDVVITGYPVGADRNFSRLKIFSLEVPFTARYNFCKDLSLSFGPYVSFNVKSSIKTRYKMDGEKVKEFKRSIPYEGMNVGLQMGLHYQQLGLYCKYSPTNVLQTDMGPKFKGLSAGFIFFY